MLESAGVKFPESVIDLELRVGVLERILETVLNGQQLTPTSLDSARKATISDLQKKYPQLGLVPKP